MKPFLVICLFVFLGMSCKKDNAEPCETTVLYTSESDTLFPSQYVVNYPGSWWEFDSTQFSSNAWEQNVTQEVLELDECLTINKQTQIIAEPPSFSNFGKIVGTQLEVNPGPESSTLFLPIIDSAVGAYHKVEYYVPNGKYSYTRTIYSETKDFLPSMNIGGQTYANVLFVEITAYNYYTAQGTSDIPLYEKFWFAKDVGLIKYQKGLDVVIQEGGELVDHHIAPH